MQTRNIAGTTFLRTLFVTTLLLGGMLFGAGRSAQAQEGAVFTSTNSASGNAIVSFKRSLTGQLTYANTVSTGGRGTGAGIGNAGAVILSPQHQLLFAVNAGSNDISVFGVRGANLSLITRVPSGGTTPFGLTISGNLLYVVNGGTPANITGFRIQNSGQLSPIPGSTQPLSQPMVKPGQIKFSPFGDLLVVTEQTTDKIDVYPISGRTGAAEAPIVEPSLGVHPFGFDFDPAGHLVVSEAVASSASSYLVSTHGTVPIDGPVGNGQQAACWLITSGEGRFAWTANAASNNISAYTIAPNGRISLSTVNGGVAANLPAAAHPLDMARDNTGHFYVLDQFLGVVSALSIQPNGTLTPINNTSSIGSFVGTGLAAY